jgi:hypothetical protein
MEMLAGIALFVLIFAAIIFLAVRRVWMRFRMIAVAIPEGSDPQAFRYKLTEAVRSFGYRAGAEAGPGARFRAPAWQKWAVGLQDISVEPAGSGAVLVTGPALSVSQIGRGFAGATAQPYNGRQPVWPLAKGIMRIFGIGIVLLAASFLAAYLSGVR